MTETEYKDTEKLALELVDWLFSKTKNTHMILTILMRSLCLFLAQSRLRTASIASMVKSFTRRRPGLIAARICLHCQCKPAAPGRLNCAACLEVCR